MLQGRYKPVELVDTREWHDGHLGLVGPHLDHTLYRNEFAASDDARSHRDVAFDDGPRINNIAVHSLASPAADPHKQTEAAGIIVQTAAFRHFGQLVEPIARSMRQADT